MKNRKAALQLKLSAAMKAYDAHADIEPTAENALAHAEQLAELEADMRRASAAVAAENVRAEVARNLEAAAPGADRDPSITGGEDRSRLDPKGGFHSLGEFMQVVRGAGVPNARPDKRLVLDRTEIGAQAPTTYGQEGVGADGGFAVPVEFAQGIYAHSLDEGNMLADTSQIPVQGNAITFPKDETTPWSTNGITMLWQGEASQIQQRKPNLGEFGLKLKKLAGIVPLTDELLEDAGAMGAYAQMKLGAALAYKINDAIANGNGAGMPMGYLASGAAVTQAAEVGQTADTVNAFNVAKMFGRLTSGSARSQKLRWLINNDVLNQVMTMTLGNQPIWTPPQAGFTQAPHGFLLGRPINLTQIAKTLGDLGDIQLVDLAQYVSISKGPKADQSMHLFFDYGLTAFRLTFRMDGAPWQTAPITPANGSNTLSPFVQLAAR